MNPIMQKNNLSEILKHEAVERNLCTRWTDEWVDNSDQQTLIDKYKSGIDFILKQGEWPTNDFIKSNFDRALLNRNLIYVDEYISLKNAPSGIYILNGNCSGSLHFGSWTAATVYLRHDSNVRILADDFSKVFVRIYDNAIIKTSVSAEASIKVVDRRKIKKQ